MTLSLNVHPTNQPFSAGWTFLVCFTKPSGHRLPSSQMAKAIWRKVQPQGALPSGGAEQVLNPATQGGQAKQARLP